MIQRNYLHILNIYIFIYFLYTCIYVYIGLERYILTCHGGEDSDEFHFYFFKYLYFLSHQQKERRLREQVGLKVCTRFCRHWEGMENS